MEALIKYYTHHIIILRVFWKAVSLVAPGHQPSRAGSHLTRVYTDQMKGGGVVIRRSLEIDWKWEGGRGKGWPGVTFGC